MVPYYKADARGDAKNLTRCYESVGPRRVIRLLKSAAASFACLAGCAAALGPAASFADPVDRANALRTGGCGDRPALTAALARSAALDAAAQRVAAGEDLQDSASAAGYHARRIARIRLENATGEEVSTLLESRFCGIVADPELTDIGLYRAGDETWLILATQFGLAANASAQGATDALFRAINDARGRARRCGTADEFEPAGPLARHAALDAAALKHAQDIAARGELDHEGADGSTAAERVAREGYRWTAVGENVASGQSVAEEVVDTWLASAGHCRNLMHARYAETGIAVAVNEDDEQVVYWVQVYAAQR